MQSVPQSIAVPFSHGVCSLTHAKNPASYKCTIYVYFLFFWQLKGVDKV
jgi:hypothetical protein